MKFFKPTLLLGLLAIGIGSCNQSSSSSDENAGNQNNAASDIEFIQEKYGIISKATDYKVVPFNAQCDEISFTELNRKYNAKGELAYLQHIECGEHGCSSKEHYYWDGKLIFIFHKNDFTPGNSHIIEEHRTYFKNGKMIRCLEKEATSNPGQPPMEELLKKAKNKEVDCTPEKLTTNLSELEALSIDEAKKYFCSDSSPQMLGTFSSFDCSKHVEIAFDCECAFGLTGDSKELSIFASNMEEKACVKVNGELNALYPDWEDRDYKKELKDLSKAEHWISIDDGSVRYFGKPLSTYKYENAAEFLADVILASGEDIRKILIKNSSENRLSRELEKQTQEAIARAKKYYTLGGNDPLFIQKFDNRTYDVFVRYRQTTQYDGEANKYEGKITLLKNRGTEILETQKVKGTCGC